MAGNVIQKEDLLNFATDSFVFKKPGANKNELIALNEMLQDPLTKEFLPDLPLWLQAQEECRATTIIYDKEVPIGVFSIYIMDDEELVVSQGIVPSQRGKRYSTRVKQEVFAYLFRTFPSLKNITTYIDANNKNNLKAIERLELDEITPMNDPNSGETFFKVVHYNPSRTCKIDNKNNNIKKER